MRRKVDQKTLELASEALSEGRMTEEIVRCLRSRWWRLNNLYKIKDKDGNEVTFKMNFAQKYLYQNLWHRNVVLKIRQEGVTTFCQLYMLDACLFTKNLEAGIIAHTRFDAEDFFENKIKFAYDRLPRALRDLFSVEEIDELEERGRVHDSARTLSFVNGSRIRVGTSLRSSTLQLLHISEFGKISKDRPDRAKEIREGALQTVHENGLIVIESTAEGKYNHFYDIWQTARRTELHDVFRKRVYRYKKHITPYDYKAFFISWVGNERLSIPLEENEELEIPKEISDYFAELEKRLRVRIKDEQKKWWLVKWEELGEGVFKEYPATPDEAFQHSIEGAYYRKQIAVLEGEGRIGHCHPVLLKYNPCVTAWDLGIDDETFIWFACVCGDKVWLFDYLEGSGEGMDYWISAVREKERQWNIQIRYHYAPHDINVRDFSTGKSRFDYAKEQGFLFRLTPSIPVEDGIHQCREFLRRWAWFDVRCEPAIEKLRAYRKDPRSGRPVHDETSHCADAFRYLVVSILSDFDLGKGIDIKPVSAKLKRRSIRHEGALSYIRASWNI